MMSCIFMKCNCRSCVWVGGFAAAILMLLFGFHAKPGSADTGDGDFLADVSFPTFYRSGFDVCTGENGKPLILLFSSASCSHCEWAGEIFDFLVRYYIAGGLIEAHHYDVTTGDDLLTEETETEVPVEHLQLKVQGDPEGYVPYFNFGCKYERVGNGYEKDDDAVSEAAEMRQVIEALIRMLAAGD